MRLPFRSQAGLDNSNVAPDEALARKAPETSSSDVRESALAGASAQPGVSGSGDGESPKPPMRVSLGGGGIRRADRTAGRSRSWQQVEAETEDERYSQRELVHTASRKRAGQYNAAAGGVVAAGAALVGAYWGLRCLLRVFHTARRNMLRQLLLDLAPALNALGVTYWVDFGSLLGLYRDGDLILHDNDIDIAILDPDWRALEPALAAALAGKGYWVKAVSPSEDPTTVWLRVYCALGMADLFGAVSGSEDGQLAVQLGHGHLCDVPEELVLPPAEAEFRGVRVAVPADVEGVLALRYGPEWHVPKYMDKGSDVVEQQKLYARVFSTLGRLGIRI